MASITVQCPCGEAFERPIQRGRPAIWCPQCRLLPIAQRPEKPATVAPVKPVVVEGAEPVEAVVETRTVSRYGIHDTFNYTEREAIEEAVAEIRAKYEILRGELTAEELSAWEFQQTVQAYQSVKPKWWQSKVG